MYYHIFVNKHYDSDIGGYIYEDIFVPEYIKKRKLRHDNNIIKKKSIYKFMEIKENQTFGETIRKYNNTIILHLYAKYSFMKFSEFYYDYNIIREYRKTLKSDIIEYVYRKIVMKYMRNVVFPQFYAFWYSPKRVENIIDTEHGGSLTDYLESLL